MKNTENHFMDRTEKNVRQVNKHFPLCLNVDETEVRGAEVRGARKYERPEAQGALFNLSVGNSPSAKRESWWGGVNPGQDCKQRLQA